MSVVALEVSALEVEEWQFQNLMYCPRCKENTLKFDYCLWCDYKCCEPFRPEAQD